MCRNWKSISNSNMILKFGAAFPSCFSFLPGRISFSVLFLKVLVPWKEIEHSVRLVFRMLFQTIKPVSWEPSSTDSPTTIYLVPIAPHKFSFQWTGKKFRKKSFWSPSSLAPTLIWRRSGTVLSYFHPGWCLLPLTVEPTKKSIWSTTNTLIRAL